METFKELEFVKDKDLTEEDIISKLVSILLKKPVMEKISCEEIDRISLDKDAENSIVAFVVKPLFLHPLIGLSTVAV